ncbi:head protein [Mesorhizobium sp. LNJC384A00]|uniref:Mu-like prophage major head subunit gpT family protein n=1 Tax=Mesorhizobium sp. LNJC384A00 TaxID=1287268 RepID=UPI0003CE6872|nr:Mu-like prophage major head subunit gpT family protein [Mesorhizobium sp. LNJC384A00]ESY41910.1 head protein [Mesorhizobium sp. LNJC384A00]
MLATPQNLKIIYDGFSAAFNKGFTGAPSVYKSLAMIVPSTARQETYAWLGQVPEMRKWIGDRIVNGLRLHGYTVVNEDFEQTISVPRNDVQDDQYGVLAPFVTDMGRNAGEMPDKLTLGLLSNGFTGLCYDGQPFFDVDHPVGDNGVTEVVSVSNFQGGAGEPWYLLDTSKPIKPLIFQERMPLGKLVAKNQENDDNVFWNKEYIYGSDGRCNAGYGLWQLAYASKQALTAANYEDARKAMASLLGDTRRPLGIKADTLVCGPNLEGAAMRLLNNGMRIEVVEDVPLAITNEWAGTAKPIVTQWVQA